MALLPLSLSPERLGIPEVGAHDFLDPSQQMGLDFLRYHPTLDYLIIFAGHDSPEDLGPYGMFENYVRATDVYVPEAHAAHPKTERALQKLSDNIAIPQNVEDALTDDAFRARVTNAIRNSGTQVLIVDMPDTYLFNQYWESDEHAKREIGTNAIPENIIDKVADFQLKREWTMLGNLGKKLAILANTDDGIDQKVEEKRLKVLLTLGKAHTTLFHMMRQLGMVPERTFVETPVTFTRFEQRVRRKIFQSIILGSSTVMT